MLRTASSGGDTDNCISWSFVLDVACSSGACSQIRCGARDQESRDARDIESLNQSLELPIRQASPFDRRQLTHCLLARSLLASPYRSALIGGGFVRLVPPTRSSNSGRSAILDVKDDRNQRLSRTRVLPRKLLPRRLRPYLGRAGQGYFHACQPQ